VTITLLKEAEQFGIFAFDEFDILISQLAPLPFDFAFQLVPVAFDFVPAHGVAPIVAPKSDHIHRYSPDRRQIAVSVCGFHSLIKLV